MIQCSSAAAVQAPLGASPEHAALQRLPLQPACLTSVHVLRGVPKEVPRG